MDSRAFRVAMLHMSQTEEVSPNEDTPPTENKNKEVEQLTLEQRKKVIDDSLDSYYSPVINAYLRKFDDIEQLMIAAQYAVSQFGGNASEQFNSMLSSYKIKILNATGDVAMSNTTLKKKFISDPAIKTLNEDEIDTYVRSELGQIQRDTLAKVKKVITLLRS